MFSRTLFQRIVIITIVLTALALFGVVALRYPTTEIPVLSVKVEAGSVIEEAQVRTISWPLNAVFPGLVNKPELIIGKTAAVDIAPNTPIVLSQIGERAAQEDTRFPAADPSDVNKLKFFLQTDLRRSAGQVILPGDYVDVVYSDPEKNRGQIILQKIHVVGARTASGQDTTGIPSKTTSGGGGLLGGGGSKKTLLVAGYLLALTPEQVEKIAAVDYTKLLLVHTTRDAPDIIGPSGERIPSGLDQ